MRKVGYIRNKIATASAECKVGGKLVSSPAYVYAGRRHGLIQLLLLTFFPMSTEIHPTAIIEPGAELEAGVTVGAYAYIGARVKIRKGTEVMHHATVDGLTSMGKDNEVHPYAYVGGKTHDLKFQVTGSALAVVTSSANLPPCTAPLQRALRP